MKVGKAIYNILSQSTDVQSNFPFNTTDYAPTGTELVTNGDFSAGAEEVDYPNFTNSDLSQWNIASTGGVDRATKSWDAAEFMRLTYNIATGAAMLGNFGHTYPASYKVTMRVRGTQADGTTAQGSAFKSIGENNNLGEVVSNPTLTSDWQDYEFYIVSLGSNFRFYLTSAAIGDIVDFDSISVQELGEGWVVPAGWSIGEDKAICDGSTNNAIRQSLSLPVGNIKVTFKVEDFTSGTLKLWINLPAFTTIVTATAADTYEAYITTTSGANNLYFYSVAFVGSITNITVQEMILTKIFPELAPPDIDAPYIVYSVVSNSPSDTKNANGDIDTANIEVYGFQDTYNKAVDLGVSVRAALDRKTGTYNTIEIQSTNYVNEQMDVNEARKLWAAIQDYSIRIKNI
jgi:hypothetical protein